MDFLGGYNAYTAFLISYYNRRSTIEAAWKYLIINAVGLLLAFLGTITVLYGNRYAENFMNWQDLIVSGALDPAIAKSLLHLWLLGMV